MQELAGRLRALDPEASETLKVIAYFDALTGGHASAEVLLRGAAMLGGCAAGFSGTTTMRVDATGRRSTTAESSHPWSRTAVPGGGVVWIEREGAPHANDEMILERVAIAFGIL